MTPRERYRAAHIAWQAREYPNATKDHGVTETTFPKTQTANGLQQYIVKVLKYLGHHGERTNTMGYPVAKFAQKFSIWSGKLEKIQVGTEWRKGSGTTGSSDVKGHINNRNFKFPIPVYLEIKIGRDAQSKAQERYQEQITSTGALYALIKTPEDFWLFYDYAISLK